MVASAVAAASVGASVGASVTSSVGASVTGACVGVGCGPQAARTKAKMIRVAKSLFGLFIFLFSFFREWVNEQIVHAQSRTRIVLYVLHLLLPCYILVHRNMSGKVF